MLTKSPRLAAFVAFNVLFILVIVVFLLAPIVSHFASRSEEISERAAQLTHFRQMASSAGKLNGKSAVAGDPFFPGSEERLVSADLQASLKAMARRSGVELLGIRGLQVAGSRQLRMVNVAVDFVGTASAVRNMIADIESQTPFLFVAAASVQSVNNGEDGPLRVEMKVQGAMRGSNVTATEVGSQ